MHFYKYLNLRVRRIGEHKVFLGFFKNKKEKKHEIEFHNSIQD